MYYWPFVQGIHQLMVDSQHKESVMEGFDGFFDGSLDKLMNKQLNGWSNKTP